jgi:hypothetical protein
MPAHPTKEWGVKPGMSKRFYAACAALPRVDKRLGVRNAVKQAYAYADQLIYQENENLPKL